MMAKAQSRSVLHLIRPDGCSRTGSGGIWLRLIGQQGTRAIWYRAAFQFRAGPGLFMPRQTCERKRSSPGSFMREERQRNRLCYAEAGAILASLETTQGRITWTSCSLWPLSVFLEGRWMRVVTVLGSSGGTRSEQASKEPDRSRDLHNFWQDGKKRSCHRRIQECNDTS